MSVVIGGGSGFIGSHLIRILINRGWKVITVSRSSGYNKITWEHLQKSGLPNNCQAVISMTGENILNPLRRWNSDFKKAVWSSRVDCTKVLADAISKSSNRPKVFISMSGVGYYKPDVSAAYDESSMGGNHDFMSQLCTAWESASKLPSCDNVRWVIIRSGVVLGHGGGMFQQIYWPFFFGLGGHISSGKQWFPWIHVADTAGFISYAIENRHVSGVYNGVAPETLTNAQFTKVFASAMNRPALFPVPDFMIKAVFGLERGKVILEGQMVVPKRTLESGYNFLFPNLNSACRDLV